MPSDPVHTLSHMREMIGDTTDSILVKPLSDVPLSGFVTHGNEVDMSEHQNDGPIRKRPRLNGEQQVKRHKYDVLKSFFRIYFKVDSHSMVLKDAIFNLYSRKIPAESRIARNAMYRHMWTFFKEDKISAFQSNYREYIKGLKLLTGAEPLQYDGFDKDIEVLQSIDVRELFDFQEEDLAKNSNELISSPLPPPPSHSPSDYVKESTNNLIGNNMNNTTSDDDFYPCTTENCNEPKVERE